MTYFDHLKLILLALFSLLLGAGLIVCPFMIFGYMVFLLPYLLLAVGVLAAISCWQLKHKRRSYSGKLLQAIVLIAAGAALYFKSSWCDVALWYIFAGYLIVSAWYTARPAWQPGIEKQSFSRWIGSITVWGFAGLMLFMPRSGLSDALQLLGCFSAAWGVYQLLLPPVQK